MLHHPTCMKPCKEWEKLPINWLAGFLPSTVYGFSNCRNIAKTSAWSSIWKFWNLLTQESLQQGYTLYILQYMKYQYDIWYVYCIYDICIHIIYIRTIDYINSYYWDVSTCHGFPDFLTLWTPWHLALHRRGIGLFAKLFPHLTSMKFIGFIQLWYFKMFSRFDTTIQFVFFFLGGFRVTCEPVSIWHLGMIFFSRHLVWPYGLLWIWSSCHRTPSPKGSSVRESCKNDLTFQAAEATHYNDYILYIYAESV